MAHSHPTLPVVCLMGPTASGKTPLAIQLVQQYPFDIISVDSAMIYRGMTIGTAKPTPEELRIAPHRLIDLLDPSEAYSAGQFCADSIREIHAIHAAHRIPLLVGGTMMYFRALQQGIATLPRAHPDIRKHLQELAEQHGWDYLHKQLQSKDPASASQIKPTDKQRIQRALEVYDVTGIPLSELQQKNTNESPPFRYINIGILPKDRAVLHQRIAQRFDAMLAAGFLDEVRALYQRGDLNPALSSIRAVGYREAWAYLAGEYTLDDMREKAIIATRQLAKRQLTWLRSWPDLHVLDMESPDLLTDASTLLFQSPNSIQL